MGKPIVAIVGRPNVGKSTLFNRLAGHRIAIVEDTPGVTRDRIYADADWLSHDFRLIDTGGIEPTSEDEILSQMRRQAEIAMETADVIIFMVDGKTGLADADREVASMLRRSGKPVVLAVNKIDNLHESANAYEFYNLGMGEPFAISSSQGLNLGDMLDEVVAHFPAAEEAEEEETCLLPACKRTFHRHQHLVFPCILGIHLPHSFLFLRKTGARCLRPCSGTAPCRNLTILRALWHNLVRVAVE